MIRGLHFFNVLLIWCPYLFDTGVVAARERLCPICYRVLLVSKIGLFGTDFLHFQEGKACGNEDNIEQPFFTKEQKGEPL